MEIRKRSLSTVTWKGVDVNLQQNRTISNLVSFRSRRWRSSYGQDIAKDWKLKQASGFSEKQSVRQRWWECGWGDQMGAAEKGGLSLSSSSCPGLVLTNYTVDLAKRSVYSPLAELPPGILSGQEEPRKELGLD